MKSAFSLFLFFLLPLFIFADPGPGVHPESFLPSSSRGSGGEDLELFHPEPLFTLTSSDSGIAAPVFEFTPGCRKAYESIISLKLEEAKVLLSQEESEHPANLIPVYLRNYIDFFELFFNEDPDQYRRTIGKYQERLNILDKGPKNSPYYLLTKAVVHLQWAFIQVKFGKNWDAGWAFRRSFLQIKENNKKFPSFHPNNMYQGAMQVAAGTIPDGYKWLSNLLGIRGSIDGGMKQLSGFLQKADDLSRLFHDEAVFYFLYLKYYVQNDKKGVFQYIEDHRLDLVNNHLLAYMAANLSINNQRAESAINIIAGRNTSPAYLQTPVWDLEMGYALLYGLDANAGKYFERFIRNFKGRYYMKDAIQKLSWHHYVHGDKTSAIRYRKMILEKGVAGTEADRQAEKEARGTEWPNLLLLKARLLNDGGHHRDALRLLHGKTIRDFDVEKDRLEFTYRAGRIFDDLSNTAEALKFYKEAFSLGQHSKEYFAARAALQMGFIFERKKDCNTALQWFRTCMDMKGHDYKNSLDQRAKAGIARCKNL